VVPAAASSTLRGPAQTLRYPTAALCGCTDESPSAWIPSLLRRGTAARHWQSNFSAIPPNLISRSALPLRSAPPRWTHSTSPVEIGDGNALEWAEIRRDVVFCSVVVTTSVITSLRDDELTERAMVTKIIFSRSGHGPKTVLLWKQVHTSARSSRRPCLALPRCAPPVQVPPATGNSSARRRDELGVANRNVTSEVTD
jgi:hypothetical protein